MIHIVLFLCAVAFVAVVWLAAKRLAERMDRLVTCNHCGSEFETDADGSRPICPACYVNGHRSTATGCDKCREANMCTTSGRPVDVVRAEQTDPTGQYKDYIVLCPDERAKGFVRPYRDAYKHVGRSICGNIVNEDPRAQFPQLGDPRDICALPYEHEGECAGSFISDVDQVDHARILNKGGCGVVTTMGQALSETGSA